MDLAHDAEEATDKLDGLVQPADEPENAVLVDNARVARWTGPAFALFSLVLLPWTIYLGTRFLLGKSPRTTTSRGQASTSCCWRCWPARAFFALRRSRYLATAATATATLLVVDVWFDVMTSPPGQVLESVVLAMLIELPLAAVCVGLSYHTQQLAERRVVLLLRRNPKIGTRR